MKDVKSLTQRPIEARVNLRHDELELGLGERGRESFDGLNIVEDFDTAIGRILRRCDPDQGPRLIAHNLQN